MATSKKKTVKKVAPKKTTTKKKTAVKKAPIKKAPAKTAAIKKVAVKKTRAKKSKIHVTLEQRHKMICEAAYYISVERGYENINPNDDWLQAEVAIDKIYTTHAN